MARLARVVVPGLPYHVTQRGNGRRRVFFADSDYAAYRDWLAEAAHEARVSVWAWRLMPNTSISSSSRKTKTACAAPWRACIVDTPD